LTDARQHAVARNLPLLVAALTTAACTLVLVGHKSGWVSLPALDAWELDTVDARFTVRGVQRPADDRIVIVGFDDQLRRQAPEVMQQRAGWARFLLALDRYQPHAVALDAFFAEPEAVLPPATVTQVDAAVQALRLAPDATSTAARQALAALAAVQDATRGDEKLAAALGRSGNVLLSALFFFENGETAPAAPGHPEPSGLRGARVADAAVLDRPLGQRPLRAEQDVYGSLPLLAERAAGGGAVNVLRDIGGAVRRMPLVIEHGGRYYLPLALALAARSGALGAGNPAPASYATGDREIVLGNRALPVDPRGIALLGWLGPTGTFAYVSAADVLTGRAAKDSLRDKLVLVGYTDAARDRVTTPFSPVQPGVEVHATLLHNALHGGLMQGTPGWLGLLAVVGLGATMTGLQLRRVRQKRAWLVAAAGAVLALVWLVAAQLLFGRGYVVEVAAPVGSVVLVTLVSLSTALISEGREKAELRRAFGHYVSRDLVDKILADPARVRLGGERRELSVLFSDIRGFSKFSEQMEPEQLSAFLNEYLTPMTRIVLHNGGMLDKYIGDAVMAVFGAPLEMADHAQSMCSVALDMQRTLSELRQGWEARGLPAVEIGVGLNAGPMSVGNMGSEMRFDYTVMGDSVNLASRLEGLTKEYRCAILCGPRVPELAGGRFAFRELDFVRVKGRGGVVRVYELLGEAAAGNASADRIEQYGSALAAYRQRQWAQAEATLRRHLAGDGGDGPATVLLERVLAMTKDPPGDGWDGVYDQRNK